jgi:hypothetical protein
LNWTLGGLFSGSLFWRSFSPLARLISINHRRIVPNIRYELNGAA